MIRINLANAAIPAVTADGAFDGSQAADADVASIQKVGALRLLMILLVPALLYLYESQNIPDLKTKLRSKTTLRDSLVQKNEQAKGAVEEIKKFKEDQARLQKQIDTLDGLQRERLREVKILDNLQKDIPEKVWLTRLEFRDANLTITGVTTADSDLTLLMENLAKSVFLKEVNLVKSTETPSEKGVLKKFEIACVVDRPVLTPEARH